MIAVPESTLCIFEIGLTHYIMGNIMWVYRSTMYTNAYIINYNI